MRAPHTTPPPTFERSPEGHRFIDMVEHADPDGCAVALLGMPDDTGVGLNGGRRGASEGPRGLREALSRLGVAEPGGWSWPRVFDAGDVTPGGTLAETHARVTEAARALHDRGMVPVGIGGGHDLTFPFVRALSEHLGTPPVGVYFDAHLDVREGEGSGMPFRRLVEDCGVAELHVHGLDPAVNSSAHVNWFASHGGRLDVFGPEDPWPEGDLFCSFDMDVIDASAAPGVSAPNPAGWSSSLALHWAESAGRCPRVRCFDLMELSPRLDPTGRTCRLAARLLLGFLRGFAERRA